jgi:DNA-binding transcriptional regulator YdaS (Cro superfamily)
MCARILQQCEFLQGGRPKLAAFLGVSQAELDDWLAARAGPPRAAFERAMELILAEHDRRTAQEAAGVPKRRRTDRPTA